MSITDHLISALRKEYSLAEHEISIQKVNDDYFAHIQKEGLNPQVFQVSPEYLNKIQQVMDEIPVSADMAADAPLLGNAPDTQPSLHKLPQHVIKSHGAVDAQKRLQQVFDGKGTEGKVIKELHVPQAFPHEYEVVFDNQLAGLNLSRALELALDLKEKGYCDDEVLGIKAKAAKTFIYSPPGAADYTPAYVALPPKFVNAMYVQGVKPVTDTDPVSVVDEQPVAVDLAENMVPTASPSSQASVLTALSAVPAPVIMVTPPSVSPVNSAAVVNQEDTVVLVASGVQYVSMNDPAPPKPAVSAQYYQQLDNSNHDSNVSLSSVGEMPGILDNIEAHKAQESSNCCRCVLL